MRRILAHTMATPELDPVAALDLAAGLELAGLEVVCQRDYPCGIAPDAPFRETSALAKEAERRGLVIAGLSPYPKGLNARSRAEREDAIAEFKDVILRAEDLGCPRVRAFAGASVAEPDWDDARRRLAASLAELADFAKPRGVELNVENHMDTMALSARRTMAIVDAADRENVGVLYDQANLTLMGAEPPDRAIARQWPKIRHVHVKDFRRTGDDRVPVLPGDGPLDWSVIVGDLHARGYDGFFTLEYEKRWFPDELPPAADGLRAGRDHVRAILDTIGKGDA
jgi:L-ribulose-5-phosphate 3-epimerase